MQEPKKGMFVCASTLGGPVSPQLRVPGAELSHNIPKYSIDEAALQLCHYAFQVSHQPSVLECLNVCCSLHPQRKRLLVLARVQLCSFA